MEEKEREEKAGEEDITKENKTLERVASPSPARSEEEYGVQERCGGAEKSAAEKKDEAMTTESDKEEKVEADAQPNVAAGGEFQNTAEERKMEEKLSEISLSSSKENITKSVTEEDTHTETETREIAETTSEPTPPHVDTTTPPNLIPTTPTPTPPQRPGGLFSLLSSCRDTLRTLLPLPFLSSSSHVTPSAPSSPPPSSPPPSPLVGSIHTYRSEAPLDHTTRANDLPRGSGSRGGRAGGRGGGGYRGAGRARPPYPRNVSTPFHASAPPAPFAPPPLGYYGYTPDGRPLVPVTAYLVLVSHVPFRTTAEQLRNHFAECGEVLDMERRNQDVFLYFREGEGAERACRTRNGSVLHDALLSVSWVDTMTSLRPM